MDLGELNNMLAARRAGVQDLFGAAKVDAFMQFCTTFAEASLTLVKAPYGNDYNSHKV